MEAEKGYRGMTIDGERLLAHRVLTGTEVGEEKDVHHCDHDVANNAPTNLKVMSHQENSNLRRKRTGTSSQYIGVVFDKARNKWRARITLKNGRLRHLGYFTVEKDARDAYNTAAIAEFGLGHKTLNNGPVQGNVWDVIAAVKDDTDHFFNQAARVQMRWKRGTVLGH